ncbi:MAG: hypothetical protein AVDCRST_MAG33-817, partial [uncultured Thermomicrobiales bacterium]
AIRSGNSPRYGHRRDRHHLDRRADLPGCPV